MSASRCRLAIDPGISNGGYALRLADGTVKVGKLERYESDLGNLLRDLKTENPGLTAYLEAVGTHVYGNSASSSVKLAQHMGALKMAFYLLDVPCVMVSPAKWQDAVAPKRPTVKTVRHEDESKMDYDSRRRKATDAGKKVRKAYIKDAMAKRFANLRVTDWNADALGILTCAEAQDL